MHRNGWGAKGLNSMMIRHWPSLGIFSKPNPVLAGYTNVSPTCISGLRQDTPHSTIQIRHTSPHDLR